MVMILKLIDKDLFYLHDSSGKLNLFSLTYPLAIQFVLNSLFGTVHTILMTYVSESAVAGIGVANTVLGFINNFSNLASCGMAILISYALGRGDKKKVNDLFTSGVILTVAILVFISIIGNFTAAPIIGLFNLKGTANDYGVWYFRLRLFSYIITGVINCFVALLRCCGKTLNILISSIVAGVTNIVFSYWVVKSDFFTDKVLGIVLSATVASLLSLCINLIPAVKLVKFSISAKIKDITDIVKLGFPSNLGLMFYSLSVIATTGMISNLGEVFVNANIYVSNITQYSPIISWSLYNANSVMLGRKFGNGRIDEGNRLVRQNAVISISGNMIVSIITLIFNRQLIGLFTKNETIIKYAFIMLIIDVPLEIFRACNHIYGESALVCAKDVMFTSTVGVASNWLIAVGGCWILCNLLGLGIVGAYLALMFNEMIRAIIFLVRWKKKKWEKNIKAESISVS